MRCLVAGVPAGASDSCPPRLFILVSAASPSFASSSHTPHPAPARSFDPNYADDDMEADGEEEEEGDDMEAEEAEEEE